jgi:hypothetical protein
MSEVDMEVPETGPIGVDDVLAAIQQKNIGQAKAHFNDLMGQKVTDALEAEKISIASQVFNPSEPQELAPTAAELAAADVGVEEPEAELDLEDEVEAAFEEEVDAESN